MTQFQRQLKRSCDIAIASALLLPCLPVFLIIAGLIKLTSPGPVFFHQRRVGKGELPFSILKFRTMHVLSGGHELGSVTIRNDPRIFRVGSWLRKYKIDELPQILNVLTGSMSLVGPRPTVADDYKRMTEIQRQRALVRPGITGLAQINGGAAITWPQRINYDLQYVQSYRLKLDLVILITTARLVLTGRADSNPIVGDEWNEDHGDARTAA